MSTATPPAAAHNGEDVERAVVGILEGRIRHADNQLAQAKVSIESWKDKYERDLKEQRRVFDKYLKLRGLQDDYSQWYSENIA